MQSSNSEQIAHWVHQRRNLGISDSVAPDDISETIQALIEGALACKVALMMPNLFPGCELEILYIPADTLCTVTSKASAEDFNKGGRRITPAALSAIGYALVGQLAAAGNDMVEYKSDDGMQVIAFLPHVRRTVLQALGLSLLEG